MGTFLHVAVWKGKNVAAANRALAKLAEGENLFCIRPEDCEVFRCPGGTAIQFNEDCNGYGNYGSFQFETLAEALSKLLSAVVLVCSIYDGDFWDYYLCDNGRELSRFSTVPDYFEEMDDAEYSRWAGNADVLAEKFNCPASELQPYICFWTKENEGKRAREDDRFPYGDEWQLFDFLARLGFPFPEEEISKSSGPAVQEYAASQKTKGSMKNFFKKKWAGIVACFHKRRQSYESEVQKREYANLPRKLTVDMAPVEWVRMKNPSGVQTLPKDALTEKTLIKLLKDVLDGKASYLAVDFRFQGEGVYVKRLNKKVYKPFHSTLVLHHGTEGMACMFFSGDNRHCHILIGDFHAYREVDSKDLRPVQIGNAILPEYGVHKDRKSLDMALRFFFQDLESADRRLKDSGLWSTDNFAQGEKKYKELRRTWGELED